MIKVKTKQKFRVEFQSKFYSGNGSAFTPFCLNQVDLSVDLSTDKSHLDEDSILQ